MQIKCVAIDDEPYAVELVAGYIKKFPLLKLVQTFDDAITGAAFLRNYPVDLLFIDINMPDISGIELVRSLAEKPMIIFTTAYKKFAIDGFELDAIDYLLKPISFDRFSKAVGKAIDFYRYKNLPGIEEAESIFIRSEYKLIKISLPEIEYIESVEDYCKIFLSAGKPVMTLMPLKVLLEKLPADKFRRIHRSYIVPLSKIRSVVQKKVRLTSVELPVSDSYSGFLDEWK
jgi:two-component system LytT family response regulator